MMTLILLTISSILFNAKHFSNKIIKCSKLPVLDIGLEVDKVVLVTVEFVLSLVFAKIGRVVIDEVSVTVSAVEFAIQKIVTSHFIFYYL
jgi:hypothetical protein